MFRYGISSLLFIGALLIGIFYLKPAWSQFQEIRRETEYVRALSAEFDELIQNRDALIAKLNLVSKDDLRKLEALIPQGAQSLEYLISLEQAGRDNGIGLAFTKADISPPASSSGEAGQKSSPKPGSPQMLDPSEQPTIQTIAIKDLPVGVDVSGPYELLKKFLGRLERFGRLTDISTLNFSASDTFTFSMSLITYYQ